MNLQMDLVTLERVNSLTEKGSEILKKNEFFEKLIKMMNSSEFLDFYDSYFKDWSDIETIIFYIKLYKTVEYEYKRRFNNNISPELMTYSLYNILNTKELRKCALEKFRDFKELKHVDMSKNEEFRYLLDFNLDNNVKSIEKHKKKNKLKLKNNIEIEDINKEECLSVYNNLNSKHIIEKITSLEKENEELKKKIKLLEEKDK